MVQTQRRQLAAIMFTDVAGYTALMQSDEETARILRDRHRTVLGGAVAEVGGELVEHYGDGSLSIFGSAISAVTCALEIQRALAQDPVVPLRIGIHTGDIVREDRGVYGDGVNVASRVQDLCPPGEVLISGKVVDDVKNQAGMFVRSLGRFELKNVSRSIEIFTVDAKESSEAISGPDPGLVRKVGARAVSSEPTKKGIAVLPFLNMSADSDNEFFSDGITEEIINALTRVSGLRVTARTSSFAFKGKDVDVRDVGSKLNVGHVLEGSVRRAGGRVRITAQLIDTETGYHVFSDVFDRVIEDIFETQDEIALKITGKLRASLPGEADQPLVRSRTKDPETYSLYLRGRFYMNQWNPRAAERALDYFERAVAREPNFAAGYVGLSHAYTFLLTLGHVNEEEGVARAREAAARAEELDPGGGEALTALAVIKLFVDWDFDGAAVAFQKALSLNPGSAQLHHDHAFLLRITADSDGAITALEKATVLDPLSSPYNNELANAYTAAGRFEEAAAQFERTLDTDPDFYPALEGRGWLLLHSGDLPAAIDAFRSLRLGNPHREQCLGSLGFASGVAGETEVARECLAELHRWHKEGREARLSFEMALVHAGLGEFDEAFRHLDDALERRDGSVLFLRTSVRGWGAMREDPRFEDLLERIGLG